MDTTYKTQEGEIVRDMTEKEIAEYQLVLDDVAANAKAKADGETVRETALAKLAALGLTTDDLKALGL